MGRNSHFSYWKGWKKLIEKIRNAIKEPLKKMDIDVDSIEYVKDGSYYFLNIILDRVNGLDLDTVVEATNIINPILDELDIIEESYILDVSSKERNEENE